MAAADACPWCSAPRVTGVTCPGCGANYAKAALIKTQGRAAVAIEEPVVIVGTDDRVVDDPALEWKLAVAAIPAALALGLLFHIITPSLQRIFFGMPVHELGH